MKKIRQKWGWLCLLGILCFIGVSLQVSAEGSEKTKSSENQISFFVEKVDSERQIDPEKDYFDLQVNPDETVEIQVRVKNRTEQPVKIGVYPAYATTNANGIISYQTDLTKKGKEAGTIFPEIVGEVPPIELDAREEKIVTLSIQVPSEPFSGILLGGLYFRDLSPASSEVKTSKQMVTIQTDYSYLIGVQLREQPETLPEAVDVVYVKPNQIDGNNVFEVMVSHPVAQILRPVQMKGDIYAADDLNKPLYQSSQEGIELAPNTTFQWQMALPDQQFKAGDYVLKLDVTSGEEKWTFERKFEVTQKEADQWNKKSLLVAEEGIKQGHWLVWWVVLLVVLVCLIGAVAYWRFPRARKWIKNRACEWQKLMGEIKIKLFDEKVENNNMNRKKQKQHRKTKRRSGR